MSRKRPRSESENARRRESSTARVSRRHGQPLAVNERLLQRGRRLSVREPPGGLLGEAREVLDGLLGVVRARVVIRETVVDRPERSLVQRLQRLAERRVQGLPAGSEKTGLRDPANPVMPEIEPLADPVEHAMPDELLQPLGSVRARKPARALDQREVERTIGHRGDRSKLTGGSAQALQPSEDELAHGARNGPGAHRAGDHALLDPPHRLHGDERIPLAAPPDLRGEPRDRPLVGARPGEHAHEVHGLVARQRADGH